MESGTAGLYEELVGIVKRQLLTRVVRHARGNQVRAAKLLGISRSTLRNDLRSLCVAIERNVARSDDKA
ncbi:MAG TPA: helix-turn-helix domain-containing protein [Pirellulales bacterium]|nr:helix-turn-helix domain-containing protein [Pirellulales bacterium]